MPRLEYDVVFNLDQSSTETLEQGLNKLDGGSIKELREEVQRLENQLEKAGNEGSESLERTENSVNSLSAAFANARSKSRSFTNAQLGMTDSTDNLSKTANNANQILFSFGDAVQDGAQFQHGFASGARAVGNNLTFASEQISIASAKAGSFTGALRTMGSALLGPAGIVLAINAAVTALTVFGDSLFGEDDSVAEKAKSAREELKKTREEINRFTIQFKQLSSLQKEAFPDLQEEQAFRQQLQFARELEANLQNRLDAQEKLVSSVQGDVDNESRLLKILQSNESVSSQVQRARSEGLITQQQSEAILQGRVDLQATINKLQNQLNNSQNELVRAKERQSSLEVSVQSSQERQIRLGAKLEELSASRSTETFKTLQNLKGQQQTIAEMDTSFGGRFTLRAQERISQMAPPEVQQPDIVGSFERRRAEERRQFFEKLGTSEAELERSIASKKVNIHGDAEKAKTELTRRQVNARRQLITQAAAAGSAILTAAFGKTKEVRIAQALIDTYASAQAAYYSQLTASPDSPIRAALAASAAVASGLARIATMKSIEPGSSSGGGAVGMNQGISTSTINPSQRRQQPDSRVANQTNQQAGSINISLEGEFDSRMVSVKADEGRKLRENNSIQVKRSSF